eukprot:879337-Pleurochrysis_carterae.AAC.1
MPAIPLIQILGSIALLLINAIGMSSDVLHLGSESDDPGAAAAALQELLEQYTVSVDEICFSVNEQTLLDDLHNASDGSS